MSYLMFERLLLSFIIGFLSGGSPSYWRWYGANELESSLKYPSLSSGTPL